MLNSTEPETLTDVCEKYGIESEKKASNMIITVKKRFQTTLKQYIRSTLASENDMADELKEIMQLLPKRAQHSK